MACQFCTMPGGRHDDECPYDSAAPFDRDLMIRIIDESCARRDALVKAAQGDKCK